MIADELDELSMITYLHLLWMNTSDRKQSQPGKGSMDWDDRDLYIPLEGEAMYRNSVGSNNIEETRLAYGRNSDIAIAVDLPPPMESDDEHLDNSSEEEVTEEEEDTEEEEEEEESIEEEEERKELLLLDEKRRQTDGNVEADSKEVDLSNLMFKKTRRQRATPAVETPTSTSTSTTPPPPPLPQSLRVWLCGFVNSTASPCSISQRNAVDGCDFFLK
eukprot:m.68403 g.68403  ORF g.68403 m.68403 type:complete len:218 (-) comp8245_c0_seq3:23-676(-)